MNTLAEQLRHNAWANHTVLAAFEHQPALLESAAYDGEPLFERAYHLAEVERGFLDVLRENNVPPRPPREFANLRRYVDETGADFAALADRLDEATLERECFVPWWDRAFPVSVLIAQVLSHSAQHRAELAWELARAGVSTGELDYIRWAAGGRPRPGEAPDLPPGA